jgi:hypothetical protein
VLHAKEETNGRCKKASIKTKNKKTTKKQQKNNNNKNKRKEVNKQKK